MIDLPVSANAIAHVERLIEAAVQGGTLRRIERADGSRIYYVKKKPGSTEEFLNKILYGKPGPSTSATVLRLVVNQDKVSARQHVDAQVPALFAVSAPASAA